MIFAHFGFGLGHGFMLYWADELSAKSALSDTQLSTGGTDQGRRN